MGQFGDAVSAMPFRRCRFGDGRFGDKSVTRHDTFDRSAFYVLFQKNLGLALGLRFRVSGLALGQTNILCN